jgi:hypothetical protein
MSLIQNYERLKASTVLMEQDILAFHKGQVKASGMRARNHLLNIKKLTDAMRKQILDGVQGELICLDKPVLSRATTHAPRSMQNKISPSKFGR